MLAKIPTLASGCFLFRGPTEITCAIYRELLVVFVHPGTPLVGIALILDPQPGAQFYAELNQMLDKLRDVLPNPEAVELKAFGMAHGGFRALQALMDWTQKQKCILSSLDVGRGVARNLLVSAQDGRVGVRYTDPEGWEGVPEILVRS